MAENTKPTPEELAKLAEEAQLLEEASQEESVKIRILTDIDHNGFTIKANQVASTTRAKAEELEAQGQADSNPAAVEYALTLNNGIVEL